MHYGHANALRQAKALGDVLVVGLVPDLEIRRCKGPPILNDHERLDLLRPIAVALAEEFDRRARRVRVQVQSAVPLAADQEERLRRELHDTFKLQPILQTTVDPDLLGGLVVRVEDWVYDGAVRAQLETIRNQLIERSSHEIQSRRDRFCSPDGD